MRLAHGWTLVQEAGVADAPPDAPPDTPPDQLIAGFMRPALRAVPRRMADRLGACRFTLRERFDDAAQTSQWSELATRLEISAATAGMEQHDIALEVLSCLGQALWERLDGAERAAYWKLLDAEIRAGITGEIDEAALEAKRALLAGRAQARSAACLERYGRASFAATAAEYVHCLWHDVSVRTGPEYLPAPWLRRRLELLARWFPPDRGYALFATEPRK
jgi:hypothetical protein